MNPSGKPDAGNLPVRFEEGARCQRVAAPPLLHPESWICRQPILKSEDADNG
jgi:hypothetical protein